MAIITGAGSGIGRCCAVQLAERGWGVALVGRTRATLSQTGERLGQAAWRIIEADVGEPAAAAQIVVEAMEAFGRIDALVNNAGYAPFMAFHQFTDAELDRTFQVNALGPIRLMNRAWPHLCKAGGRIVNVSSYSSLDPFSGLGVYGAAKSALNVLGRASAREGREFGVRVFTVAPGAVETGMLREIWSEDQLPAGKTLRPEEVASVIVACVVGQRDHETGGIITVPSP
ncbi:MAG: SDR family oxidoreductase [Leptolyngbya sp. PLA3]|nr:MAG: SDR family oxidoreductase [Cyanobacteria bacterium CYA]MCE7967567.1 SDR family oxidoreductase [Leptolyngbya sp. PL-A3]